MHKTISTLYLFIAMLYCQNIQAQTGTISGTVNSTGASVAAATVSLLNAADSSWIRSELTDDSGHFMLHDVRVGNYLLSVNAMGYNTGSQAVTVKDGTTATCTIELKQQSLQEVTVTGKKPFMEAGLGKITVNIEGSPTATGSNALELLRKLPGVTVSQDGSSISMQGKQGVLVLVDDRPTYLSGDQLAAYLKSLTADEITQMELITQPGAKYDAAGDNGIINIKIKRGKRPGFNGFLSATYGQGVFPYGQGSVMLNYKSNKLNLSLSGGDVAAVGFADWTDKQQYTDPLTGNILSASSIRSNPVEHFSIASLRLAADYDCSANTTIGISTRGTYHTNWLHDYVFSSGYDYTTNAATYNTIISPDGFIRKDAITNLYLDHKFSKESSLSINADYLVYNNSAHQDIDNTTYDAAMQPASTPLVLHSLQPSDINVYSLKADYTNTLKSGIKLEAGFKSSLVQTDNNAIFNIYQNSMWMPDTTRSNRFAYKENIDALYASADKKINDKWEASAGLRAEYTYATGVQYVHDDRFTRDYLSLFPTAYLVYKKDKDNQFELNYGRRIDRPAYQQLNPFIYYSFQYSYSVGNPYLQPQYTNNIELKHSYKNMLITTLRYSATTDVISDVIETDNATKVVYSTTRNLASNNSIDYSVVFNKDILKWWMLNLSGNFYDATYTGFVNGSNMRRSGTGYSLNLNTQFDLGKGWKTEGAVYYNGRSIWSVINTGMPMVFMNFGVSKKINDSMMIKLAANDPLDAYRMEIKTNMPGFSSDATYKYATQQLAMSFSYNFGAKQSASHESKSIDETKRMKID